MSFDYFHPYCMHTHLGPVIKKLQQERNAVEIDFFFSFPLHCGEVSQGYDGTEES